MLRLHLAKLVKRIPLRFTRENQITFPLCSVKLHTQDLRNKVYGTKKVFHVFCKDCFHPGTLLRCDRVVVMLRLHLAKLVKRIPLRFTRENQITFPLCSVKLHTQDLRNKVYGTKKVFHVFCKDCFHPGTLLRCDRVVVMLRLHLAKLVKRIALRFTRENQITFLFCSVKLHTQDLRNVY